ncbi:MAG: co-chaperone GroES [Deltaproteobacteria bacterium]|nr:co-chaperone GroES [Deltaproteobacteria bacterium]
MASSRKKIRKVHPLGMRILVKVRKAASQTDAGLYLPETARSNRKESILCDVLEVAKAVDDETEEEANISGIPNGSVVLIPEHAGVAVAWDEDLRIVETKEVLALVSEVSVS